VAGRRPLPTAVKKLRGNPGRRPLNPDEPKLDAKAPAMPPDLPELAVQEWKAIVPLLLRLGVITEIDGKALAAYCFAYARWREAEDLVAQLGGRVVTERTYHEGECTSERFKRNPADVISSDALKLMKSYLIEFGLTPATRSKLRLEKPKDVEDPLEAYLLKQQNAQKHIN
jgi:P27 family predicted phage terminase small subunit